MLRMSIRTLRFCALLTMCLSGRLAVAQTTSSSAAMPDRLTIGENTYFDFGPPFDYYEIYILEAKSSGTAAERITVTPRGDACLQPAKVDTAMAVLPQTLMQLLGNKSPCLIPEKALRPEAKRCRHCLNFSGAKITMQVSCGGKDRLIPFNILESDWFDKEPNTPQHTSQTLQLLSSINSALGSNVVDRPMFATGDSAPQPPAQASAHLSDLASGKFDVLFPSPLDKVSELYEESQVPHQPPTVTLAKESELFPLEAKLPSYPPIARAAHIQGEVTLRLEVQPDGTVGAVSAESGPEMLKAGAIASAKAWVFPKSDVKRSVTEKVAYKLDCIYLVHTNSSN